MIRKLVYIAALLIAICINLNGNALEEDVFNGVEVWHISGFNDFPQEKFSIVQYYIHNDAYIFNRITGDSISYEQLHGKPDVYITWVDIPHDLIENEPMVEASIAQVKFKKLVFENQFGKKTIDVPFLINRYLLSKVDYYCRIVPAVSHDGLLQDYMIVVDKQYTSTNLSWNIGITAIGPNMISKPLAFLIALILSILVETLVLIRIFQPEVYDRDRDNKRLLIFTCIAATTVTITIIWWIFPLFIGHRIFGVLVSEVFALLAEGVIYTKMFKIPLKKGMRLSLLCNLASYLLGLIVFYIIYLYIMTEIPI